MNPRFKCFIYQVLIIEGKIPCLSIIAKFLKLFMGHGLNTQKRVGKVKDIAFPFKEFWLSSIRVFFVKTGLEIPISYITDCFLCLPIHQELYLHQTTEY